MFTRLQWYITGWTWTERERDRRQPTAVAKWAWASSIWPRFRREVIIFSEKWVPFKRRNGSLIPASNFTHIQYLPSLPISLIHVTRKWIRYFRMRRLLRASQFSRSVPKQNIDARKLGLGFTIHSGHRKKFGKNYLSAKIEIISMNTYFGGEQNETPFQLLT